MHPLVSSVAVILAGAAALWQATDGYSALTTEAARRGAALRDTPPVPAVTVETMGGARARVPPGDGRAAVVEFIYTSCPDICQTAGAGLARLGERIGTGPLAGRVRLVSLSFDPLHDTPARMAEYGRWHGADGALWTVARPDAETLPVLLDGYGVTVISDRMGGYVHNTALHIVSPAGRLVSILDPDDIDGAEAALAKVLR
jgi:protein SCO1/2